MEAEVAFMDNSKNEYNFKRNEGRCIYLQFIKTRRRRRRRRRYYTILNDIIKIRETITTNDSTNSFEFEYAEGNIIR